MPSDRARDLRRALAGELRAVIEAIATRDGDEEATEQAVELARRIRTLLDGPRAERWYEAGLDARSDQLWHIYRERSPLGGCSSPLLPPKTTRVLDRAEGGRVVETRITLTTAYEGPPHAVHGGIVAAIFDDLMGNLQRVARLQAFTAELSVRYHALTPLDEELVFRGWIERVEERRVTAQATCQVGEPPTRTADARGLFIGIDLAALAGSGG